MVSTGKTYHQYLQCNIDLDKQGAKPEIITPELRKKREDLIKLKELAGLEYWKQN
jgi:hypothetical protein